MKKINQYSGVYPLVVKGSDLAKYFFDGQTKSTVEKFALWAGAGMPNMGRCKRYSTEIVREAIIFVCADPSAYYNHDSFKEAKEATQSGE